MVRNQLILCLFHQDWQGNIQASERVVPGEAGESVRYVLPCYALKHRVLEPSVKTR